MIDFLMDYNSLHGVLLKMLGKHRQQKGKINSTDKKNNFQTGCVPPGSGAACQLFEWNNGSVSFTAICDYYWRRSAAMLEFLEIYGLMFHFCQSVMVNRGMYCYNNVLVFVCDANSVTFSIFTLQVYLLKGYCPSDSFYNFYF